MFVCVKEVLARDSRFEVAESGTRIEDELLTFEINECDEYALEAAVTLLEQHGGEVCLLTVGRRRTEKVLRKALAVGAQRAILIVDESRSAQSPLAVAAVLAAVLRDQSPDLILTGTRSDDFGHAQTGVLLAGLLGLAHATIVVSVDAAPAAGTVTVVRELEGGTSQRAQLRIPAVLTVQGGTTPLRYPTMGAVLAAKKRPIDVRRVEDLNVDLSALPAIEIRKLTIPVAARRAEFLEGKPDEAAAVLVRRLKATRVL